MSRWRVVIVLVLVVTPFVTLAGFGSFYLWKEGLAFQVWWPMAACLVLGYALAYYWQRKKQLLRPLDFAPPPHWTEQDQQAWKLVEERAKRIAQIEPDRLAELQFYLDTGQEMALELARFYHPRAQDPIGALTIPEILAVVELAAHDLSELVDRYLPAGHLLTINNWRQAKQASDWYQTFNKAYWLISALFSPVNTSLRYAAAQLGMSRPLQLLQENLIGWFYTAFVHRLGTYLIDVNSGRLRVGAKRYRELLRGLEGQGDGETEGRRDRDTEGPCVPFDEVRQVTITVTGQVKAGKSSLINAILGEQRAVTDILPATDKITRYDLHPKEISDRLSFLDTVGYGHDGPREDQVRATEEAAQQSDLLLLVLHARNPARQADLALLQKLRQWFADRAHLKMPPVLGILTHIDVLSPAMEWSPPYNWQQPERPKERQIADAWEALREQLGDYLVGIVPLCTQAGKVYGMEEWLMPALAELLDEARAVALLRCLRAEANRDKIRKVFQQLLQAGRQAAKVLWQGSVK